MATMPFAEDRSRRVTTIGLSLLTAMSLNACTYWAPSQESVGVTVAQEHPHVIRVTTADGTVRELRDARIVGDSVIGLPVFSDGRIAFALADVRSNDVQHIDTGRMVLVAAVIGILSWLNKF